MDYKGELQTFMGRNCRDFPFVITYDAEATPDGKMKAKVTPLTLSDKYVPTPITVSDKYVPTPLTVSDEYVPTPLT